MNTANTPRQVSTDLVKPAHFAHFVVRVADLDRSIGWYRTVLGMEIVHRNPMIAFMTYDDEHHRMALVQVGDAEAMSKRAPGVDHVAYTLDSLGDLLSTYKRLKAEGILPAWPINHGLTTSIYYEDPDGLRVEFQVENFATKAELNGYMHSAAFAENPIGKDFDPDTLLERFENGDPMQELLQLGSA